MGVEAPSVLPLQSLPSQPLPAPGRMNLRASLKQEKAKEGRTWAQSLTRATAGSIPHSHLPPSPSTGFPLGGWGCGESRQVSDPQSQEIYWVTEVSYCPGGRAVGGSQEPVGTGRVTVELSAAATGKKAAGSCSLLMESLDLRSLGSLGSPELQGCGLFIVWLPLALRGCSHQEGFCLQPESLSSTALGLVG